ncbi:hypothetical protein PYCC9005_004651 [Savitreella phatthalungensis]
MTESVEATSKAAFFASRDAAYFWRHSEGLLNADADADDLFTSWIDQSSARQPRKKRKLSAAVLPPQPKPLLFQGLTLVFVPSSRANAARRARMDKVASLGGTIISEDEYAQHKCDFVVCGRGLGVSEVLKRLGVEALQGCSTAVSETYTPECVAWGRILPIDGDFLVPGLEPSPVPAQAAEHSASQTSLQIKQPRPRHHSQTQTTTPEESPPTPLVQATAPHITRLRRQDRVLETPPKATERPTDALDQAIDHVRSSGSDHALVGPSASESDEDDLPAKTQNRNRQEVLQQHFQCAQAHRVNAPARECGAHENVAIIERLQAMLSVYGTSVREDDRWRVLGYRRAIVGLRTHPTPVRTYAEARAVSGVGDRIAQSIAEMVEDGFDNWRTHTFTHPQLDVLRHFLTVHGVGEHTAHKWVNQGLTTFDQVLARANPPPTSIQKLAILLHPDITRPIPRKQVTAHLGAITRICHEIDRHLVVTAVGSYRRGAEASGDIDVLLTRPGLEDASACREVLVKVVDGLRNWHGYLTHDLSSSRDCSRKWLGVARLGEKHEPKSGEISKVDGHPGMYRRLDLLVTQESAHGAALLYFTGSAIFNRSIRLLAKKKGFKLNDKGLFDLSTGIRLAATTEADIFTKLGIPYRSPSERCIT